MVRDAVRMVAMTGGRIDDNDGATPGPGRRVAIRLTRDARDPKIAQALRSAVGYAAADLSVIVVVEPPARALLQHDEHAPAVVRAIATLRALGHRFVEVATTQSSRLVRPRGQLVSATRRSTLAGEVCPYTFVRTKLRLEELPLGAELHILVDHAPAADNVPRSLVAEGQEVVSVAAEGTALAHRRRQTLRAAPHGKTPQ